MEFREGEETSGESMSLDVAQKVGRRGEYALRPHHFERRIYLT
jgi:hypothetical protein